MIVNIVVGIREEGVAGVNFQDKPSSSLLYSCIFKRLCHIAGVLATDIVQLASNLLVEYCTLLQLQRGHSCNGVLSGLAVSTAPTGDAPAADAGTRLLKP